MSTFGWPGSRRLAVNFVVNFEEGAELSPAYGDAEREPMSEAEYLVEPGARDLLQESIYEYGAGTGVYRLAELFREYDSPFTVFACGAAVERHPKAAEALVAAGADFVGHGYRWVSHLQMTEDEEQEDIEKTVASIRAVTGCNIAGWFTRPLPSANTRRLLVARSFLFDSDSYGSDTPYFVPTTLGPHLVVPYTIDVNDINFWRRQTATAEDWFLYARDTFDVLYAEGHQHPRMMSVGLHPRIIGRPGRFAGLRRLLKYVRGFPDVWVCGRTDLATFWRKEHAALPGTGER